MVSWTVPPLRSGLGSSSLTSLPRAVTSIRCPPGWPRSVCSSVFSSPSLPIFKPGMISSGFLFSVSYSSADGRADIADQMADRRSRRIEAGEAARGRDARSSGRRTVTAAYCS